MSFFPGDIIRSDLNRNGYFHLHRTARTTYPRLLGPSYFSGVAPSSSSESDAGSLEVDRLALSCSTLGSADHSRSTTIMIVLGGYNVSYCCPFLGNHVQVVTGGALTSYFVAVYIRGTERLDILGFKLNLYLGSAEPRLRQITGDGGCDVTRLSFVADAGRELP